VFEVSSLFFVLFSLVVWSLLLVISLDSWLSGWGGAWFFVVFSVCGVVWSVVFSW